jgi:hypothetical protein
MDMSLFDQDKDNIKATLGKRDHRNKRESHNPEDVSDLRKKANKREKPRQRIFNPEDEE